VIFFSVPIFFSIQSKELTLYGGLTRGVVEDGQLAKDGGRSEVGHQLAPTDDIVLPLGGHIYLGALLVLVDDEAVLLVAGRRHCIDNHLFALLVH